jgi:hypothetical protein
MMGSASAASASSSVRHVLGGDEDWKATLRQRVPVPSSFDRELKEKWTAYTLASFRLGANLDADSFAEDLVARHFPHLQRQNLPAL